MLKHYKKITSKEREVNQLQENIEQALNPIIDKSIVDGVLLKSIKLVSGKVNNISHKLGRKALGYIVVSKDQNSEIWDSGLTTTTLQLQCSSNVQISIWVF